MLDAATRYTERGFPVFPCVPGLKTPLTGKGFYDATTDGEQIESWWAAHPRANVAIPTEGLLVLDIDGADNPWLQQQHDFMFSLLSAPSSITPRGGQHFWFSAPSGKSWGSTTGAIAPRVDTRGSGGYALVPPSVGDDGRGGQAAYLWKVGTEPLWDLKPEDLPKPPGWLVLLLDEIEERSAFAPVALDHTGGEDGNLIPSGQRNSVLAQMAGDLRRMGSTRGEMAAFLHRVNEDRCDPALPKSEVEKIARSISRYHPDQATVAAIECHWDADRTPIPDGPRDPGPLPAELLEIPGLIGDVMAYTLRTSWRRQPVLALGAAVSLMGVLTGQKVRDEYDTRTNVYCLGVAPSGGGKERPRQVNREILFLSGGDRLIGPEGFASHAGIVSAVQAQTCILFQVDELGKALQAISQASHAPHLVHVVTNLMKLFTCSSSVFRSDAYADRDRNCTINQPHVCLWGTTVPTPLLASLSTESISDGFISRLLIFESPELLPVKQKPGLEKMPLAIVDAARAWIEFKPAGNLNNQNPEPVIWPVDKDAEEVFEQFDSKADERLSNLEDEYRSVWSRAVEKARKLSLVYACSRGVDFGKIDSDAAAWGVAVSDHLTRRMIFLASQWISENKFEHRSKRILRVIAEACARDAAGISQRELYQRTRSFTRFEREEVLESLLTACLIQKHIAKTSTKPKTLYKLSASTEVRKEEKSNKSGQFFPFGGGEAGLLFLLFSSYLYIYTYIYLLIYIY